LVLFSIIIGYISVFAWFGKPHPVSCAFQPWLLGLPALSMIIALSVKIFRIWRIFNDKMSKNIISDWKLIILWFLLMLPAILIVLLWTIISTPTAKMTEVHDGKEHYICRSDGFTGQIGGYVFFGLLVGYGCLILFIGVILSILTRKVPSLFNESKLLAISIYNIGFLSIIGIPVIAILQEENPFAAWILRTCAILYAFTATMILQFAAPLIGIIVFDKGKNVTSFNQSGLKNTSSSSSSVSKTITE